jgi:HlyD family secretion protein
MSTGMNAKRLLLVAGMVVVLVAITAASMLSGRRAGRGVEVYLEPVARADVSQTIKASGQVDPKVKVDISAHVIAKIEKLYVKEGDTIVAGAPFLRLEREAFQAGRNRAAAQLEIARSQGRQADIQLADAEIKLRRARRLREEDVLPQESFDQAELAYRSAQLTVEQAGEGVHQAVAELEKAEDDLRKTVLYAPITGKVIALQAEEGEVVVSGTMNNPASVIGTIADLSEILVEVDVDENEIVHAAAGQPVEVFVDAIPDTVYTGSVVEIGSSGTKRPAQPDVTFFKVKVLLDAPDERLRAGMSARADIEVDTHHATLVVPIQSVVYRRPASEPDEGEADEIRVVFVDRDGEATQTPVEIGLADPTRIEILEGLAEGDRVVTGPYRVLRDLAEGARIRAKEPTAGDDDDSPSSP